MEYLHVEGNPSLLRDVNTHAIVNSNKSEFETYMKNKTIMLNRVNEVTKQNEKIDKLETDINDIKHMLQLLINKEN
jgi:hypothetical protein